MACIRLKKFLAQKSIEPKLKIVQDAEKDMDAFASLPKIEANLQILVDVLLITNKDLDLI